MKNGVTAAERERDRNERIRRLIRWYRAEQGERLDATRAAFGRKAPLAVDIHTHSNHSDGRGVVAENLEHARLARLDFVFATDHNSLGQKRAVKGHADASWGQEPPALMHHIGLLCNRRLFKPKRDSLAADVTRARALAPFVWIAHPAGWFPNVWRNEEALAALWTLGPAFAIEVLNGANKLVSAYDRFDARAVALWDQLLSDDRQIAALGGSDAHSPEDVGTAWTGIVGGRRTPASIIKALNAGRCFASESSLISFTVDGQPMGASLTRATGQALAVSYRVADAGGVSQVRLVTRNGKVAWCWDGHGREVVEKEVTCRMGNRPTYYRLESSACDGRRAFSSPIYVSA